MTDVYEEARGLCRLPVSHHFPLPIRNRLVAAAATPFDEVLDPLARVRAINEAIAWCRRNYPEFFRPCEVI
jgi:hypothetical protein